MIKLEIIINVKNIRSEIKEPLFFQINLFIEIDHRMEISSTIVIYRWRYLFTRDEIKHPNFD